MNRKIEKLLKKNKSLRNRMKVFMKKIKYSRMKIKTLKKK